MRSTLHVVRPAWVRWVPLSVGFFAGGAFLAFDSSQSVVVRTVGVFWLVFAPVFAGAIASLKVEIEAGSVTITQVGRVRRFDVSSMSAGIDQPFDGPVSSGYFLTLNRPSVKSTAIPLAFFSRQDQQSLEDAIFGAQEPGQS